MDYKQISVCNTNKFLFVIRLLKIDCITNKRVCITNKFVCKEITVSQYKLRAFTSVTLFFTLTPPRFLTRLLNASASSGGGERGTRAQHRATLSGGSPCRACASGSIERAEQAAAWAGAAGAAAGAGMAGVAGKSA